MKKKIFFFTVARSDFGILSNILEYLKSKKNIEVNLVVGSAHKKKIFGETKKDIKKKFFDKIFFVNYKFHSDNVNKNISNIIRSYDNFLIKKKKLIDAVFILGDRYEMLSISLTCKNYNIPIFHYGGGCETQGSLDNIFRKSISNMASIHYVESKNQKEHLIKSNIKKNIHVIGSQSLENKFELINKKKFEKLCNIKLNNDKKIITACFHADTTKKFYENIKNLKIFLKFLESTNSNIILTYPNADQYYKEYIKCIEKYKNKKNFFLIKHLGKQKYFSLLNFSDVCIGNSSSGIIETMFFKIPSISVGERQKNRFCNKNVIYANFNEKELNKKFRMALTKNFKKKISKARDIYYKKNGLEIIKNSILSYLKNVN